MDEETERFREFQHLAPDYMVSGWQSQETMSCLSVSKAKYSSPLRGTSDQNGFHLVSIAQVSKLSPREAKATRFLPDS